MVSENKKQNKANTSSNKASLPSSSNSSSAKSKSSSASSSSNTATKPVKAKKWVVDKPAWTETKKVPVYEDVLKFRAYGYKNHVKYVLGITDTYEEVEKLLDRYDNSDYEMLGYESHWETKTTYTTKTIQHEEIGHWE